MKYNICSKDISIIIRYVIFIIVYMYSYEKNLNIYEIIDYIIDDALFPHIEHIQENIQNILFLFEEYKSNKKLISEKINTHIKNNNIDSIGIVGIIIKLIINEYILDKENIHLVMNDYFTICNIYNIPNSYIKMINKIIKSINNSK